MLQVQDAVRRSLTTFAELFSDLKAEDLRLEEVSLTPDESSWLVTVSYKNPDYSDELEEGPSGTGLRALMGTYRQLNRRVQKTIKLRADTGDLVGIKAQWEN